MNDIAVYMIVPNDYKDSLFGLLLNDGFKCTVISSHGMYLKSGQTTCLIVTDKERYEALKHICVKLKKEKKNALDIVIFSTPVINFDIIK